MEQRWLWFYSFNIKKKKKSTTGTRCAFKIREVVYLKEKRKNLSLLIIQHFILSQNYILLRAFSASVDYNHKLPEAVPEPAKVEKKKKTQTARHNHV